MCGIAGFLTAYTSDIDAQILKNMTDALLLRGPDDAGYWHQSQEGIALGHRRLAIVDLSPAGHQPMISADGRYVMVFNGEIYNHPQLRQILEAASPSSVHWRGHSDTETLLAGFSTWGVEGTLARCVGMFAIALWDRQHRELVLARDRLGEKPLYYGWQGEGARRTFLFGSELKALRAHPSFSPEIDRGALALLMRHNYVPAPYSIYRGIAKLEPGCVLRVSLDQPALRLGRYWDLVRVIQSGSDNAFKGSALDAVDVLEGLIKDAVGLQMMADVPLGAFLSGGIDSSTVVALMQSQSSRPVRTFTIGFHEEGYNEADHAKAVAAHLGTQHTELYVTPQEAMQVIPSLPGLYCEPFADSSQIPTFLVSQLARQHVTVSLSGDAGDELFCGYSRYSIADDWWRRTQGLSQRGRRLLLAASAPFGYQPLSALLPINIRNKLARARKMLSANELDPFYRTLVSQVIDPCTWLNGVDDEPPTRLAGSVPALPDLLPRERMMALDCVSYLPDDILVKVDRAAMGVSLEPRVPFLDHRVVEFAWQLPLSIKLHDGVSKWPLRQVLYRHVPSELIDRPKKGFAVPVHAWLRGPLREWAETLLDERRLMVQGYFKPERVRAAWLEHLSGRRNHLPALWTVLMFQAWLDEVGHA